MLKQIKMMLGFVDSDNPSDMELDRDEKLKVIIDLTKNRLKALLGGETEVPGELEYIVVETSIKRYNRIGSETATSHSVEGESWSFSDNDFDEFKDDIDAWMKAKSKNNGIRGLKFL